MADHFNIYMIKFRITNVSIVWKFSNIQYTHLVRYKTTIFVTKHISYYYILFIWWERAVLYKHNYLSSC